MTQGTPGRRRAQARDSTAAPPGTALAPWPARRSLMAKSTCIALAVLAAACGGTGPSLQPIAAAVAASVAGSAGCGLAQASGVRGGTIIVGGVTRSYTVSVPARYDPSAPLALVFGWHGSTGTGAGMRANNAGVEYASAGNALFVYPQGLPILGLSNGRCSVVQDLPINAGGPAYTSAQPGQSCVGWDWRPDGRDIAF